MRHFLLTWYGITDMKACLGLEETGGPVLAALKTGEYTDVMILAYTDPSKSGPPQEQAQKNAARRLDVHAAGGIRPTAAEMGGLVDAFSNTPQGHQRFDGWLRREVGQAGMKVALRVVSVELASLNDSKGIYAAAGDALDHVLAQSGEKRITFYISPGTPVMAFTWAFLSLVNPEMDLRVIACPDFRKPPEQIPLPYELLAPSARKRTHFASGAREEFDLVFHLFGEQRLPSLLGMIQFPCKHHVFVTNSRYPADVMKACMPAGASFDQVTVEPFDPMSSRVAILKVLSRMPAGTRVGFNLTGGTKLMFAGAIAACRKVGGTPFYFETRTHSLIFLDDFRTLDVAGIDRVDQFIELNGFGVSRPGWWADDWARERRRSVTLRLWDLRRPAATLYRDLSLIADEEPSGVRPFQIGGDKVSASLGTDGTGRFRAGSTELVIEQCPDFARYVCGGWLEEFTYLLLEPLLHTGQLRDLRIGLKASWAPGDPKAQPTAQEFDVAFTDGKRLFVVECKAGGVFSEDIYRLQDAVRNYGGNQAVGILVAAFPLSEGVRRRVQKAENLLWISGQAVAERLANVVSEMVKPSATP